MKVTKITTQPTFQPIELKITIESQEEKSVLRKLFYSEVSNPRILCGVLSNVCLVCDSATTLKRLLDNIGDCL